MYFELRLKCFSLEKTPATIDQIYAMIEHCRTNPSRAKVVQINGPLLPELEISEATESK